MHLRQIIQVASEALTPLLIVGGLSALAFAAFLLFLKVRHKDKVGPEHRKGRPDGHADRSRSRSRRKKP